MTQQTDKSQQGGALSVSLHPLVLLTISDHFTRARLTTPATQQQFAPRVVGAILGTQKGRQVEVFNCFELIATVEGGNIKTIEHDYLKKKQEQCTVSLFEYLITFSFLFLQLKKFLKSTSSWVGTLLALALSLLMLKFTNKC